MSRCDRHDNRDEDMNMFGLPPKCGSEYLDIYFCPGRKIIPFLYQPKVTGNSTSDACLHLPRSVWMQIRNTVGSYPPETGGILGGKRSEDQVTHFHYDQGANRTGSTYSPDYERLNALLKTEWNPADIDLLGVAHSHPSWCRRPSDGDMVYARVILEHNPQMERLWLPLVISESPGQFELLPYYAERSNTMDGVVIRPAQLIIGEDMPARIVGTFTRVVTLYDLERLAHSRLVIIGVGGAAQFVEDMARSGVGEMVLIDPDVVSESNIATQQVYRRDIGRPKVDCIAERVQDINPCARIKRIQQPLEAIDDETFQTLAKGPLNGAEPVQTLLCGFTDQFQAQARVNRLALKFGLPSLCAGLHAEGRSAEITFTYPGVTPACHRCVLESRYWAYLKEGFVNNVTSNGSPIFATTRLNAIKGFITMAILHHGIGKDRPGYGRWGTLLARIGNRNLVVIRLDPDSTLPVFERVLSGADQSSILFDETVWRPQVPENTLQLLHGSIMRMCPECGGTGNLLDALGKFSDTRDMVR